MLNVIALNIDYCQKYKRTLLLDAADTYSVDMCEYVKFTGTNIRIISGKDRIRTVLASLDASTTVWQRKSAIPSGNIEELLTCPVEWCLDGNFVFRESRVISNYDNAYGSYIEDIIYCIACGGGNKSHTLWRDYVTLSDEVMISFVEKRRQMGNQSFSSIQVRNTDITCDYNSLDVEHLLTDVYVATDDPSVVTYFKERLVGHNVFNFTTFPDKDQSQTSRNLHCNQSIDGKTRMIDTLHDLLFLAISNTIVSISEGGYVQLARYLQRSDIYNTDLLRPTAPPTAPPTASPTAPPTVPPTAPVVDKVQV
jgi:hypothetical protein